MMVSGRPRESADGHPEALTFGDGRRWEKTRAAIFETQIENQNFKHEPPSRSRGSAQTRCTFGGEARAGACGEHTADNRSVGKRLAQRKPETHGRFTALATEPLVQNSAMHHMADGAAESKKAAQHPWLSRAHTRPRHARDTRNHRHKSRSLAAIQGKKNKMHGVRGEGM